MTATPSFRFDDAVLSGHDVWAPAPSRTAGQRALLSEPQTRTLDVPLYKSSMKIELLGPEPDWLYNTLQGMQHLVGLPPNWDSYGSARIQDNAIVAAMQLLALILGPNGVNPMVVPTSEGGLQLEWHQDNLDVEIELTPVGGASAYVHDHIGDDVWEENHMTPNAIARVAATLTRLRK
jgi:hypothetical protein